MELIGLLLFVLWVLISTVSTVLTDGRKHRGRTDDLRSTKPWAAGNLPSESYASLL
ncbi:hypothetical protein [Arthrobacter sp. Alg241-R88]|jgi:hypothetical protein|uniref:hypothetical protein n=1 Tax=Arthrobacter sp. Alg241-R88 TaxID=2305984 RepID=UPI001968635F|nr:hypothetical protein [Arthrobacter sp. Alg241-R88]